MEEMYYNELVTPAYVGLQLYAVFNIIILRINEISRRNTTLFFIRKKQKKQYQSRVTDRTI